MELIFNKKLFTSTYWRISQAKKRFVICWGGSSSSKSYSTYQHFIQLTLTQKHDILVIRKYASTLENSVYDGIKSIIEKWGITHLFDFAFSGSKRQIKCRVTGTRILFKGLDDPEKIKSIAGIKYILAEEATELLKKDFLELNRRARGIEGIQIFILFNPVSGKHWIKKHFFDSILYEKIDDIHCTYKDNHFNTSEDVEQLESLQEFDENDYRVYALGEWGVASEGLVYGNWKVKQWPKDEDGNDIEPLAYWLDFGFNNDPNAFGELVKYRGDLYVREILYKTGLSAIINRDKPEKPSIEQALIDAGIDKKVYIIADSSEGREINDLRMRGFNVYTVGKKIVPGIKILKRYQVYISPCSENIINERDNYKYRYNKATDEWIEGNPEDAYNHHMDGIRYVALFYNKIGVI